MMRWEHVYPFLWCPCTFHPLKNTWNWMPRYWNSRKISRVDGRKQQPPQQLMFARSFNFFLSKRVEGHERVSDWVLILTFMHVFIILIGSSSSGWTEGSFFKQKKEGASEEASRFVLQGNRKDEKMSLGFEQKNESKKGMHEQSSGRRKEDAKLITGHHVFFGCWFCNKHAMMTSLWRRRG